MEERINQRINQPIVRPTKQFAMENDDTMVEVAHKKNAMVEADRQSVLADAETIKR